MTKTTHSRLALFVRAAVPLALALTVAAILLRFPPENYSFYPECPIHHFFGILCPGCGATRALAALLHGNVNEAFRLNGLLMLLLPVAGGYVILSYTRFVTRKPIRWPQPRPLAIYATLAATIVFTVARNA